MMERGSFCAESCGLLSEMIEAGESPLLGKPSGEKPKESSNSWSSVSRLDNTSLQNIDDTLVVNVPTHAVSIIEQRQYVLIYRCIN